MAGLKFGAFSQAARISNLDIDADLDMGVLAVIAAKGRFSEIDKKDDSGINIIAPARFNDITRFGKTVFEDTMVLPYTVTPSDNVYYTSDISQLINSTSNVQLNGSIVIGPTSLPISPRLLFDVSVTYASSYWQVWVYKNGEIIASIGTTYGSATNVAVDLTDLIGGDVLTFAAISSPYTYNTTLHNIRLAGDVVTYVVDNPTAETVYD